LGVAFGVVDGRTVLASASYDETVRLWDPATGTPIGEPLTGHTNTVAGVAFGVVEGRTVLASAGGPDILLEEVLGDRCFQPEPGTDGQAVR
jgi:WD40 repeat protein